MERRDRGFSIPIESQPIYKWRVILECPVAGISFHDIDDVWEELEVGTKIALVREKGNPHDINAVAVALIDDFDGDPENFDFDYILGYIPRTQNTAIVALLDMGWQDSLVAEISEKKEWAPYSDRLHIRVFVKSKEPIDSRLRIKLFDDEEWEKFNKSIWNNGYAHFRWGGFPPWELDLPQVGEKVVFVHQVGIDCELFLMNTVDCKLFLKESKEEIIDDCSPFVLTVLRGPVIVPAQKLDFLGQLSDRYYQPDFKLQKELSDKLLEFFV